MSLVPFGKRRELAPGSMFGHMGSLMDDFLSDAFTPFRGMLHDSFRLDVKESDREYTVQAELPGVAKEDVALDLREDRLTISVSRDEQREDENEGYVHRERRWASMCRSIHLAGAADEGADAVLKDGVLTVTVPKRTDFKPGGKIEIRS